MVALVKRWLVVIYHLFKRPEPPVPVPMALLPPPKAKPALDLPPVIYLRGLTDITDSEKLLWMHRKRPGEVASAGGRFYFKDDVLDQLDYYFQTIRRFKVARRDFYDLASQTGINLIPDRAVYVPKKGEEEEEYWPEVSRVDPWFAQTLPAFGSYCFGTLKKIRYNETQEQVMHTRFIYFTRYAKKGVPITIQPIKEGTVYVIGLYFDNVGIKAPDPFKARHLQKPGVVELPVVVARDGTITALKTLEPKALKFPRKNKRRSHEMATRSEWGFPQALIRFAKEHKTTPERYICNRFAHAARMHGDLNSSMIHVRVTKGDLAAVMNVDMERTPYFFKDRQPVFVDGIKKKIFHIVRPHERVVGSVSTDVHMHFRGLRKFNWNSYDVAITVPGWDHNNWAMADIAAYDIDSEKGKKLKRFLNMKGVGEMVVKATYFPGISAR